MSSTGELNRMLDELSELQHRATLLKELERENAERCELLEKTLDEATRPIEESYRRITKRIFMSRGYEYLGIFCRCSNEIEIYLSILRHLLVDFEDKSKNIVATMRGRNRLFLAQNRQDLFFGKNELWVQQHSIEVGSGWYADTNTNHKTKVRKIERALSACGLLPGKDVNIFWRPSLITRGFKFEVQL